MKSSLITSKILRSFCIWAIGLSIIFCVEYLGLFEELNGHLYNLSFRIRGERNPLDTIVIAAVDEKSLEKLGRWPFRREYYAELLDRVHSARAVGFDIILAESSENDLLLEGAIKRHDGVILPVYIDSRMRVVYPAFSFPAERLGHVHIEQDIDGITRSVFHTLHIRNVLLPSFSRVIFESVTGTLPGKAPHRLQSGMQQGSIVQNSVMKINYYGPPGTIRQISFSDIIDGKYPGDFFRDKIVLVGLTAIGLESRILSPFTQQRDRMSGVEVQANILNNLLSGDFIRDAADWTRWLTTFLLSLLCLLLLLYVKPGGIKPFVSWLIAMSVLTASVLVLFTALHMWLAPSLLYFSLTFTFVVAYIFRLEDVGQQLLQSTGDWEDTFDSIDDAIAILDSDCNILRQNKSAQKSYSKELFTTSCLSFTQRYGRTFAQTGETEVYNQTPRGGPVTEEIFDHASERYLELRALPRFDHHHNLAGMILVIRDITGRKKAEEEQRKTQSQLLQSQKMEAIGHLAGGIAHDFNNMLTAIIGYGSLLGMRIDKDSELKFYVDQILSSAEKSANLTRQLLAFSRKQTIAPRETDLNDLIKGMKKLLLRIIGEDIELQAPLAEKDITVMVDPGQIEQVLMNLCTNARDAMPNGGLLSISTETVRLDEDYTRTHDLEKPGRYALIAVTDTGIGIDEKNSQKIFEPFFTTKELGKGTGLGLSIVYGIIKQHNGNITVYSEPGRGTTFRIYLPLITANTEEAERVETVMPKGGTETILVVEDNEEVRTLTKHVLEGFGYKVIEAEDGEDGINRFAAQRDEIQLVIIDVIMPKMSGKDAMDEIKKIQPDMKVLFTSGYTADIINKKGILEEGTNFISKPITPYELLARVRELLDKEAKG